MRQDIERNKNIALMILKPSNDFTPSNIAMLNIAEYPGG